MYQMKSAHWAPEEQTMCWSRSDAATCVGGFRNHWWEALTAPGRGFFPVEGGMGVSGRPGLTADPPVALGVLCQHQSVHGGTGFPFSTPGASFPKTA